MQYSDLFWCSRGNSPSRALKTVRRTVFARRDADGRHRLFESAPCSIVHNFIQNKKSSIFSDAALGAAGGIRTSGLWSRRTTAGWYRLTMKREFCWFCTFAAKTGKNPLLVVTTGFSDILWCCLHSSGQMVVKIQINSVRTYGKNTFNKFQKGSFNSILNIFHRRQLLFQFPGKVTRNLIFAHADRL